MQAVGALHEALICSLCKELFTDPHTFDTCGHSFCYECVIEKIEGPGINTSHCPTCKLPGWKKNLVTNCRLKNAVEHLQALQQLLAPEAGDPLLLRPPAAAAAASPRGGEEEGRPPSPPVQPGNEPVDEEEMSAEGEEAEQQEEGEGAAARGYDFKAAYFGEAWCAAQLARGPPKAPEEVQALRDEIALLEAALRLCDDLPCGTAAVAPPAPPLAGGTQPEGRQSRGSKPSRKLSELASPAKPSAAGKGPSGGAPAGAAEGRTSKRRRAAMDVKHHEAAADTALRRPPPPQEQGQPRGRAGRSGPAPAPTAAEREKENAGARVRAPPGLSHRRGKTPQPQPLAPAGGAAGGAAAALAVIPDSQGLEGMDLSLDIGRLPPAALGTQAAASEVPGGLSAAASTPATGSAFMPASQLPRGGEDAGGNGSEPRSATHRPQPSQSFGLHYPALAPARTRSASPAPFSGGAPPSVFRPKSYGSQGAGLHGSGGRPGGRGGGGSASRPASADIRNFALKQAAAAAAATGADRRPAVLCLESLAAAEVRAAAERLAASLPDVVLSEKVTKDTTHVVVATDEHSVAIRRSNSFLQGLAVGAWVVGPAWVEDCVTAKALVPEGAYEVAGYKKQGGSEGAVASLGVPKRSRLARGGLFAGRTVVLERFKEETGRVKELVTSLLELGGAKVQQQGPCASDTVIVTDDATVLEGLLLRKKVAAVDQRWVLDSVAEGALAPYARFQPEPEQRAKRSV